VQPDFHVALLGTSGCCRWCLPRCRSETLPGLGYGRARRSLALGGAHFGCRPAYDVHTSRLAANAVQVWIRGQSVVSRGNAFFAFCDSRALRWWPLNDRPETVCQVSRFFSLRYDDCGTKIPGARRRWAGIKTDDHLESREGPGMSIVWWRQLCGSSFSMSGSECTYRRRWKAVAVFAELGALDGSRVRAGCCVLTDTLLALFHRRCELLRAIPDIGVSLMQGNSAKIVRRHRRIHEILAPWGRPGIAPDSTRSGALALTTNSKTRPTGFRPSRCMPYSSTGQHTRGTVGTGAGDHGPPGTLVQTEKDACVVLSGALEGRGGRKFATF